MWGCVSFFLNNLGIFDCNFGYCRWLLLFSLTQLNDDRRNEVEEEEENNTKNFHYWRIDELAVHPSCAVLRISFSIVHHLSISERRRGGDLSFTLSLSVGWTVCTRIPSLINEHLIDPNLLSLAHKQVARHIVHHNNMRHAHTKIRVVTEENERDERLVWDHSELK